MRVFSKLVYSSIIETLVYKFQFLGDENNQVILFY